MFGEAWSPMSVPDLAPDDDDDCRCNKEWDKPTLPNLQRFTFRALSLRHYFKFCWKICICKEKNVLYAPLIYGNVKYVTPLMCACILWNNKHGIGLQASPLTLWCGKCSRSILCLDILQVQSTICISHLHCNLMLSISNCAFSSFRSSLYWISIKLEGTKRSQKSSLEPLELAIASLQRMPSRPIRNHRLRSRQTHHVGKNVRIRAHRR